MLAVGTVCDDFETFDRDEYEHYERVAHMCRGVSLWFAQDMLESLCKTTLAFVCCHVSKH